MGWLKRNWRYSGLIPIFAGMSIPTWTRLANPDMADTRLFLEYWPVYLVALGLLALGSIVLTGGSK